MRKLSVLALLCIAAGASAQKKTTYYADGTKSFEGEYTVGYSAPNTRDLFNFDTATDKRRTSMLNMAGAMYGMDRDLAPTRVYNGKCVFYYPNGKTSFSGTYESGIKNGMFSYSYFTGEKEAEYNFVHGMADGKWMTWYKNGKTRSEQNYVMLTEAEMDSFYSRKMAGTAMMTPDPMMVERNGFRRFTVDSLQKMPGNTYMKFMEAESKFCKSAHWNGDFTTYYDNGNKNLEMHYTNDKRTGKWYYKDENGGVKVELTFTDGKISGVVNNMPAEQRPQMPGGLSGMRPGMTPAQIDSLRKAVPPAPMSKEPAKPTKEPTKK